MTGIVAYGLYNVSLQRSSEDKGRINVYGNKLLQLCKNNCLYIANGRIGNDKNMGKVTSKETSLVDYLIVSGDLFPYITEFEVIDFDSLFSDIHCRLQFNLSAMLHDDFMTGLLVTSVILVSFWGKLAVVEIKSKSLESLHIYFTSIYFK